MLARSLAALSDKASSQPRPQPTDCAHLASCIKFISSLTLTLPHFATFCFVFPRFASLCFALLRLLFVSCFAFWIFSMKCAEILSADSIQEKSYNKTTNSHRWWEGEGKGKRQSQVKGRCIMFQVKQLRWRYLKKFPAARRLSRKIRMFMATLSHSRQHSRVPTYSTPHPHFYTQLQLHPFATGCVLHVANLAGFLNLTAHLGGWWVGVHKHMCLSVWVSVCVCGGVMGVCAQCVCTLIGFSRLPSDAILAKSKPYIICAT